jgi:ATP-binding cassette subfamily A (ABC1) protein 3
LELGHNGAGKTTCMEMLTGLIMPSGGSAEIVGLDIVNDIHKIRQRIGYCPQHDLLFEELTVREHLEFYGNLRGIEENKLREDIDVLLRTIGLEQKGDARSIELSGGMKRKLSISIALVGQPDVIFLDEPTAGNIVILCFHIDSVIYYRNGPIF